MCFDQTQSIAGAFNLSVFSSIYFSFRLWTFICQIWGSPVGETLSSFSSLPLPFILGFILTSLQTQTSLDSLRLTLEDNMKIPEHLTHVHPRTPVSSWWSGRTADIKISLVQPVISLSNRSIDAAYFFIQYRYSFTLSRHSDLRSSSFFSSFTSFKFFCSRYFLS